LETLTVSCLPKRYLDIASNAIANLRLLGHEAAPVMTSEPTLQTDAGDW
jgi:hypothetical protein